MTGLPSFPEGLDPPLFCIERAIQIEWFRRVRESACVEGLNVMNDPKCNKVLNVITFCPKCSKVLNVITICPKCNKL